MNGMPPQPQTEKKVGPMVGALIIILVLIIAALYFFGSKLNTAPVVENVQVMEETQQEMPAAAAQADDVETLEAELSAELQDIDYSF